MYLDTVAIKSDKLSDDVIERVTNLLETTARWKNDTGEVIFQAQSGWIQGSFDAALRIGLTADYKIKARASIPPLLQGHNVTPTLADTKAGIWISIRSGEGHRDRITFMGELGIKRSA